MFKQKKHAAAVAGAITVGMLAAACGGAAGAADAPAAGGTGAASGYIAAAQRVGAMDSFGLGDTFVATAPITVDIMHRVLPQYELHDDWLFFTHLQGEHNVAIDRVDISLEDWETRRNLLIGVGDFPSVVTSVYPIHHVPWVAGGGLLPISQYLDYMPHFTNLLDEWDLWGPVNNWRQASGDFYFLPGLRQSPALTWTMLVNEDLLIEAGITEDPRTYSEWLDAMELVSALPGVDFGYGFLHGDGGASLNAMGMNFRAQGGWGLGALSWDPEADAFVSRAGTEWYRGLVQFYADMFERGIMHPEISDFDLIAEGFTTGRIAAITANAAELAQRIHQAQEAGYAGNFRKMLMPDGPEGGFTQDNRITRGMALNANLADSPYFLATLQFLDWILYSEEGREFALFGLEGQTFDRDAAGDPVLRDHVYWGMLNTGAPDNLVSRYGFGEQAWAIDGGSDSLVQVTMTPEIREWVEGMNARKEPLPITPQAPLTDLELEALSTVQTAVNDHVRSETLRFILGLRPMAEWDAFVAEVEALGVQRIVDTNNQALARARG